MTTPITGSLGPLAGTPIGVTIAVLALHTIGAALWVGGMAYAIIVLRPAIVVLEPAARMQMHGQTMRRFLRLTWHVMPLVLISGWIMVFTLYGGFANIPWAVNAMQTLGIVMAAVFAYLALGPYKRFRRAIRPGPELISKMRQLVLVNLALGTIVLVLASIGHFQ